MDSGMDGQARPARSELILGGQKSGKSRRAEMLARQWLSMSDAHKAILIATGQAHDAEMAARIARHREDRARRVPGLATVEEPQRLAQCLAALDTPQTLLVVDCLGLWLVNLLMPMDASGRALPGMAAPAYDEALACLCDAVAGARGSVVFVSNEIGLGVIPLGNETRAYVDALGLLNQRLAAICERVTLMAAGLPLALKGRL